MKKGFLVSTIKEEHSKLEKAVSGQSSLPKEQATELIKVLIKDEAGWRIRHHYEADMKESAPTMDSVVVETIEEEIDDVEPMDTEDLKAVADQIYTNIVRDWRYDSNMAEICRKASFSRDLVSSLVTEAHDEYKENGTVMGKALVRAVRRVVSRVDKSFSDIIAKGISFEEVVDTGVSYPERTYCFLNTLAKTGRKKR